MKMTKEEVAEIMVYCKEKGITYKSRLAELGIPEWRFFDSKCRYAKEQAESPAGLGEFIQLKSDGAMVQIPSFAASYHPGKGKKGTPSEAVNIEIRTPNGAMLRIQGTMSPSTIQAIIQSSGSRV